MGGVLKILAAIVIIWVAMEFHSNGVDGAFGGLFAPEITNPMERTASAPQRVKAATDRALQESEERRNRMLGN